MGDQREVRLVMADGVELAATLYLPDAAGGPQPCLLEALPYRKDDLTFGYRPEYVRLCEEHGYAVCRVDVRGTGSSGGRAVDEYPPQEQVDLAEVIAWLAAQPWCSGAVGMFGTSYSGFNALQMAGERPPALKAVCAIYASDDRYHDDVHYRGGALKVLDLVDYCHYMTPMNALPPVPGRWPGDWRAEWRQRIAEHEPWLFTWLEHPRPDAYWAHGSASADYSRIGCPVMIVAGWADGYRNTSFRTVEALRAQRVPHRLLVGPWAHAAPASALPGPRIDLVPEMAAWWDRWLRGLDNGVDDGLGRPALTCFVRTSTRPEPDLDLHEGRWVREEWPTSRTHTETLALDAREPYAVRPDVGVDAWIDCAGHLPWGQSLDQRFDDAASLTWDWDCDIDERVVIGQPQVRLRISADQPAASLSVKLCDLFADGTSALVTRGSLDLRARAGASAPGPLETGRVHDVVVTLDACAYAFAPGQRLRLSVAGADWPTTSAPPAPVTLTLHGGALELPRWSGPSPYEPPALVDGEAQGSDDPAGIVWRVERDVLARTTACVVDHGSTFEVDGGVAREHYQGRVEVDVRTHRQRVDAETEFGLGWPEVEVVVRSTLVMTSREGVWDCEVWLEAREGDDVVAERTWRRRFTL